MIFESEFSLDDEYYDHCEKHDYEIDLDEMLLQIQREKNRSLTLDDLGMSIRDFM